MCGLIGVVGRYPLIETEKNFFYNAWILDTLRGTHGSGVIAVKGNGDVHVAKKEGVPFDLIRSKGWNRFYLDAYNQSRVLMGHNRHATRGVHSDENAHPFHHGDIIMMHNGTLDGGVDMTGHSVDSDALCKAISTKGPLEAFAEARGAYACTWWNKKENQFYFVKNAQRPLTVVKFRDEIFYASEAEILYFAMNRAFAGFNMKDVEVQKVENDIVYFFDKQNGYFEYGKVTKKPVYTHTTTTYYPNTTNYTKKQTKYFPSTPKPKRNPDLLAFIHFDRHYTENRGQLLINVYVGTTDRAETVFVKSSAPITEWCTAMYEGELYPGPRYGMVPGIDPAEVTYEANPFTLEKLDTGNGQTTLTTEEKTTKESGASVIKYANLPTERPFYDKKTRSDRLGAFGCCVCGIAISDDEYGDCLPALPEEDSIIPLGLLCPFCSTELIEAIIEETNPAVSA